jgi:hypothetical protein
VVVPEVIPREMPEVILVLTFLLQDTFLLLPTFTYMIVQPRSHLESILIQMFGVIAC